MKSHCKVGELLSHFLWREVTAYGDKARTCPRSPCSFRCLMSALKPRQSTLDLLCVWIQTGLTAEECAWRGPSFTVAKTDLRGEDWREAGQGFLGSLAAGFGLGSSNGSRGDGEARLLLSVPLSLRCYLILISRSWYQLCPTPVISHWWENPVPFQIQPNGSNQRKRWVYLSSPPCPLEGAPTIANARVVLLEQAG